MKTINLLNVILLFTLSACLVKDPEPRQATVVGTKTGGGGTVNDNTPYTAPRCTLTPFKMTSSTLNFIVTFLNAERKNHTQDVEIIEITNSNYDKVFVFVNNLNKRSANFKIVDTENVEKNEAFIRIVANAQSTFGNKITGTSDESNQNNYVNILYDDVTETYTMAFCSVILRLTITQTKPTISGEFSFK